MIVELIRDNRKIVDRITQDQIEMFVSLLRQNKVGIAYADDTLIDSSLPWQNYRYLDLLNVLCVCDGVAIPDNQTYITEHWLRRDTVSNLHGYIIIIYLRAYHNG
jgi:inositol 1,4,5-triphosphate receptor type 1